MKELMFRGQVVYFAPGTDESYDLFLITIEKERNMKSYEKIKEGQYGTSIAKIQYKDDSTGYGILNNENKFVIGLFADTLKELKKTVSSDGIWKMMYCDLFHK